ncbi:carbohydrate binding domain-containing protein, partial [bacterium]|nr:carbohydrate binding domain-containing protein [bacterium]
IKFPEGAGALKISIIQLPERSNQRKIQVYFKPQEGVERGKTYQISFWCKALNQIKLSPWAMALKSPYPLLGTKSFVADKEWQMVNFSFVANKDVAEVRALSFLLGNCPPGTIIWIGEVKFCRVNQ